MSDRATLSEAIATAVDASRWSLILFAGVVGVLAGVVALVYHEPTYGVVAACLAAYLVALLVARLPAGAALSGIEDPRGLSAALVAVLVLVAVLALVDVRTAATLAIVVGFLFFPLISVTLGLGISTRYHGAGRLFAIEAATDVLVAVALVVWPEEDVDVLAILVGAYLILRGALDGLVAVALRDIVDTRPDA